MLRIRSFVVAALAAVAAVGLLAGPAAASEADTTAAPSVQQQIDAQLRAAPGGVQTSANEIAWRDGAVVMTFPNVQQGEFTTLAVANCPSGSFCFWDAANFEGRRLQFSDCGRQDLGDYGFRNRATSWQNTTASRVNVYQSDAIDDLLWTMAPRGRSANVGAADNDRADYFVRVC